MWTPRQAHILAQIPVTPLSWPAHTKPIPLKEYFSRFPFEAAIRATDGSYPDYTTLRVRTETDYSDLPVSEDQSQLSSPLQPTLHDAMMTWRLQRRAKAYIEYINNSFKRILGMIDRVEDEIPGWSPHAGMGHGHYEILRGHRDQQIRELKLVLHEWCYGDRHLALVKLREADRNNYLFYGGDRIPPIMNLNVTTPIVKWTGKDNMPRQSWLTVQHVLSQVLTGYTGIMMEHDRDFRWLDFESDAHHDDDLPTNDEIDTIHSHAYMSQNTTRVFQPVNTDTGSNHDAIRNMLDDIMREQQGLPEHQPMSITSVRQYTTSPVLRQFNEPSAYPLFVGTQNRRHFRDKHNVWSLSPNPDHGQIKILRVNDRGELTGIDPDHLPLQEVENAMRPMQRQLPAIALWIYRGVTSSVRSAILSAQPTVNQYNIALGTYAATRSPSPTYTCASNGRGVLNITHSRQGSMRV
jgi:hypothetical protein